MGGIVNVDDEEPVRREALQRVGVASLQSRTPDELVAGRQRAGKELQALVGVDENRIRRIPQVDNTQDWPLGHRRRAVGEIEAGEGIAIEPRWRRSPGGARVREKGASVAAVGIAAGGLAGRGAGRRGVRAGDTRQAEVRLLGAPPRIAGIGTAVHPGAAAAQVAAVVTVIVLGRASCRTIAVARLNFDQRVAVVGAGRRAGEASRRRRCGGASVRKRGTGIDAVGAAARRGAGIRASCRCRCARFVRTAQGSARVAMGVAGAVRNSTAARCAGVVAGGVAAGTGVDTVVVAGLIAGCGGASVRTDLGARGTGILPSRAQTELQLTLQSRSERRADVEQSEVDRTGLSEVHDDRRIQSPWSGSLVTSC